MIARIGAFSAADIGDLNSDIDRGPRHAVGRNLHRHSHLAGLILSNLNDRVAVGARLDTGDANRGARQA
jgi:hypothetical protein